MAEISKVLGRARLRPPFAVRVDWDLLLFGALVLGALGLRLWGLAGRAMHYDESLHAYYSWQLATGDGYRHEPWIHGPFQFHINALVFKLFGDSDYTARLAYAFFGAALVGLPYFLRGYLGRFGALSVAVLLALSPSLLFFSRYSRNDIYMAFWLLALFVLMWRYLQERKNRYLYLASAVLALAFATKETVYITVGLFILGLFLLSLTEIVPWALGRMRLSDMTGPSVFLLLMVSLTLPQWSALFSVFQKPLGLDLAYSGSEPGKPVGLPVWEKPFIGLGAVHLPLAADIAIIVGIIAVAGWLAYAMRGSRKSAALLLATVLVGALAYSVAAFSHLELARNYLVAGGVLLGALALSATMGLMWRWRVWLICAGIFYFIWVMLYTSVFTAFARPYSECPGELGGAAHTACVKLGGLFTGSWQGLGYWLAQHGVARGNQPWYYYLTLGSVYEFLPLLFGVAAVVYYLRRGGMLPLVLVFWSLGTFIAFTAAGEKMPWLMASVILPFIVLTGKFFGDLLEGVPWRRILRSAALLTFFFAPLILVAGLYLLQRFLGAGKLDSWRSWALLACLGLLGAAVAVLVYRARPSVGMRLAALGLGVLFLGFTAFTAFRIAYSYDDKPVEMMVYAGASVDVRQAAQELQKTMEHASSSQRAYLDYELWYPLNWYIRGDRSVEFHCYKDPSEGGYVSWCSPLKETPPAKSLLLLASHGNRDSTYLLGYRRKGPYRDLLWFPESYRRPGEDRRKESFTQQAWRDLKFVQTNVSHRKAWKGVVDYFLYRKLGNGWWDSQFYVYLPTDVTESLP